MKMKRTIFGSLFIPLCSDLLVPKTYFICG